MAWLSSGTDRDAVIGELPGLARRFRLLHRSLWSQPHLPAELLELCRLRLAQLHRCNAEFARCEVALTGEKRSVLARWEAGDHFSAAERACLAFTEVYAMDAQALTDEHADAVKHHFGDAGLVTLVEALGVLDGTIRLALLWQLDGPGEALP